MRRAELDCGNNPRQLGKMRAGSFITRGRMSVSSARFIIHARAARGSRLLPTILHDGLRNRSSRGNSPIAMKALTTEAISMGAVT